MPTYRLSDPSVSAKTFPPPRQVVCEWCGDWTDEVVRIPPERIAVSGLSAQELVRRWPHVANAIEEHEATCPERGRLASYLDVQPRLAFT